MKGLHIVAAGLMAEFEVHACTDVTGFGLLGHLHEMTAGSGVNATLLADAVPVLEGVRELAAADMVPGGTKENLAHVSEHVVWEGEFGSVDKAILADAQTSGGLLIAVPESTAGELVRRLREAGVAAASIVARIDERGAGSITVTRAGTG
jgi:selenide,water dikinase